VALVWKRRQPRGHDAGIFSRADDLDKWEVGKRMALVRLSAVNVSKHAFAGSDG
jgi:hypothetical protein